MAGYLDTSSTYSVKDSYGDNWVQGVLEITTKSNGAISYKLTMTNNEGGSKGKSVSIYLKINGTLIRDTYTSYSSYSDSRWATFPTGHNTSTSGSLDSITKGSFTVVFGVCCQQSCREADGLQGRWDDGTGNRVTKTFTRKKWTDVTVADPTITDNGDNTVTIKATKGGAGTNNALKSTELWYKVGGTTSVTKNFGTDASYSVTKTISGDAGDKVVRVYAKTTAYGTHNNTSSTQKGLDVKHYVAPTKQPTPEIKYTKKRLTLNEDWKFTWSEATAANDSSPVKGYRLIIEQKQPNKTAVNMPFKTVGGSSSTNKGDGKDYLDVGSAVRTISVNPKTIGFSVGDKVRFGVQPYTTNAKGTKLLKSSIAYSSQYEVQNAGIVHVKVNGVWKEGQVYVKVNGTWKEAESVHTRVNGAWKESQ